MVLEKIRAKKPLKLLIILLSWMIMATASAAVYYSMYMEPSVTTAAADVYFVAGGDSGTAGATGYATSNGTWVRLASLKAYPNCTLTYDEAINITNQGSSWHEFRLSHSSISPDGTPDVANFTSITFKLIAPNGTQYGGDFAYTRTGNNWNTPSPMTYQGIQAGEEWAVKVEIVAVAGAWVGITVEIDIIVDVR